MKAYLPSSCGTPTPGSKTAWHTDLRPLRSSLSQFLWDTIRYLHESSGRREIGNGEEFKGRGRGRNKACPEETPVTEVRRKGWVMGWGRVWENRSKLPLNSGVGGCRPWPTMRP